MKEILKMPMYRFGKYAIFENMRQVDINGKPPFPVHSGKIIGIKEDAPQWAKDEYFEWVKINEEATSSRIHTKL